LWKNENLADYSFCMFWCKKQVQHSHDMLHKTTRFSDPTDKVFCTLQLTD
jgi:hypothetical protein